MLRLFSASRFASHSIISARRFRHGQSHQVVQLTKEKEGPQCPEEKEVTKKSEKWEKEEAEVETGGESKPCMHNSPFHNT